MTKVQKKFIQTARTNDEAYSPKSAIGKTADLAFKNMATKKPSHDFGFCVCFFRRVSKREAHATIYAQITFQGKKATKSTGVQCLWDSYDTTTDRVLDSPEKTNYLNWLRSGLNATYVDFKITNRPIDLRLIWLVANGQTLEDPTPNLVKCFDLFMVEIRQSYKARVFGYKAFEKIKGFDTKLREFALDQYGRHASIDDVKPAHSNTLRLWLANECGLSANYSDYIVSHMKRILEFAVENEWIGRNPFLRFKKRKIKGNIVALTESEVDAIHDLDIFAPALEPVRQAFLFQCYTGLGYKDMATVTESDILIDEKTGIEYILKHRAKTGNPSIIPIITEARRIVDHFASHPQRIQRGLLIPTLTNQRYNNYLKQLGGLLNFKKVLTSHVGRRTAATTFLNKGVALESVSAMLGHSNTSMTQRHYATVNSDRVIRDLGAITKLSKAQ